MDVVNAEWALTYDKTKLELDTVRSKDYMPNIPNEVTNVKKADGKVLSNFTDISNLADFKGGKVFVRAYFKVISTGETTVDLNLKTLCVGFIDNDLKVNFAAVVRNSEVQSGVTSLRSMRCCMRSCAASVFSFFVLPQPARSTAQSK